MNRERVQCGRSEMSDEMCQKKNERLRVGGVLRNFRSESACRCISTSLAIRILNELLPVRPNSALRCQRLHRPNVRPEGCLSIRDAKFQPNEGFLVLADSQLERFVSCSTYLRQSVVICIIDDKVQYLEGSV